MKHLGLPKCFTSVAFSRWILAYARMTGKDVIKTPLN